MDSLAKTTATKAEKNWLAANGCTSIHNGAAPTCVIVARLNAARRERLVNEIHFTESEIANMECAGRFGAELEDARMVFLREDLKFLRAKMMTLVIRGDR